jgi:hypothetical protein
VEKCTSYLGHAFIGININMAFLIDTVGGAQLGPLGSAATNRPIVTAPGDYDGEIGGMIGRRNRSTGRKPVPVPLCPPQNPHAVHFKFFLCGPSLTRGKYAITSS